MTAHLDDRAGPASISRLPWRRLHSRWHGVGPWRVHSRVCSRLAPAGAPWAVLVHGLGVSGRYLAPLALALAPRFRVAVPDLPGHGRTACDGRSLGIPRQAETLGGWLDVAGIDRPHLVANSLGCQVVLHLAAGLDADVRSLMLVGPTMDPAAPTATRQAVRLLQGAVYESLPLVALIAAEQLQRPTQGVRELRSGLDHDTEAAVRRVTVPTTVVRGARDRVAPLRWIRQLVGWLPNARVVDLPVGAHAVHASHPRQVAALLAP